MRLLTRAVSACLLISALAACGGGGSGSGSSSTPGTLTAGMSETLAANSSVMVPSGTTVAEPNGGSITINGNSDTIIVQAGSVITVPSTATGPANNTVTDIQSSSTGTTSATLTLTALAGSPTRSGVPVDGTGANAVFWGGGHLAVNASNTIVLSDRNELREVSPAGVVTTLIPANQPLAWDGIAVDAQGDIFGSGTIDALPTADEAAIEEVTSGGVTQSLFSGWESSLSSPEVGQGGLAIDGTGNLYLEDEINNRIVKFASGGTWTVLAGGSTTGNQDGVGAAASFTFEYSQDLAIDTNDNLYVRSLDTVRKIAPDGTVTTLVTGLDTASTAIAVDLSGNIYTAGSQVIYKVSGSGTVTSYPIQQTIGDITSMATDSSGNLYFGSRGIGAQIFRVSF
jgi:hypothetical protein